MKIAKYLQEGKDFSKNDNGKDFLKSIYKDMDDVHKRFSSIFRLGGYPAGKEIVPNVFDDKEWDKAYQVYKKFGNILDQLDKII